MVSRFVWLLAGSMIAVTALAAPPTELLVGSPVVFNRISDGCPKLEELDKLASDNAVHDRGAYYLDFRSADCTDANKGDEGLIMEINAPAKSHKIWLNKDQQAYWFRTLSPEGDPRFAAP